MSLYKYKAHTHTHIYTYIIVLVVMYGQRIWTISVEMRLLFPKHNEQKSEIIIF